MTSQDVTVFLVGLGNLRPALFFTWDRLWFFLDGNVLDSADYRRGKLGGDYRRRKLRYSFEDYVLDSDRLELRRGEKLVSLEPRVFDLLAYVVRNRERVVTKDDMIKAIWNGRIVSESTLTSCINGVRSAVGDDGDRQRLIKTLPRKGIRFVGDVREEQAHGGQIASRATPASDQGEKPAVAVLPFEAIGSDVELESFTDGLTEDIITGLSRLTGVGVIARNTMLTYKGRAADVRAVAKDLGAQYVLEGSVRKAGERLRMTAQLIEAETGHHLWATKIDRATGDLFEVQDEFTQCVVAPAQTQLCEWLFKPTAQHLKEMASVAKDVLALDPANGNACRVIASSLWHQAYYGFIPWDRDVCDRVLSFAQRAVVTEGADAYAHWVLGLAHLMAGQHDRALVSMRRALDINPNFALAYGSTGTVLAWAGRAEESIANNEIALRINPSDVQNYHRYFGLSLAHYLAARYAKAHEYAAIVVQLRPDWWLAHVIYAAALARTGRLSEARDACSDLRRIKPTLTLAALAALPFAAAKDRDHVASGLREAGLPDN
jgi:TolB-like protein/Flp pilus assembly protein TadD